MTTPPIRPEFPGNSEADKQTRPEPKMITSKPARAQRESFGSKARKAMITSDIQSVGEYILWEVALPAVKQAISDVVTTGIERLLYGDGASRPTQRSSSSYTSYNRAYQSRTYSQSPPRPQIDRSRRFKLVALDDRAEADNVLRELETIIHEYGSASVGDLYGMVGMPTRYTDEDWGWTDLSGSSVRRVRNEYIIDIPDPKKL
jgi:gp067|nr:MAG TPA: hypothetical protein [Caudoviricetes sp.]